MWSWGFDRRCRAGSSGWVRRRRSWRASCRTFSVRRRTWTADLTPFSISWLTRRLTTTISLVSLTVWLDDFTLRWCPQEFSVNIIFNIYHSIVSASIQVCFNCLINFIITYLNLNCKSLFEQTNFIFIFLGSS